MAFTIKGEYLATCDCQMICPCSIDGQPTGKGKQCHGATVFHIETGNANGIDVSGQNVGMIYNVPNNFTAGNVRMGVVIDKGASDAQAKVLEQIFKGDIGGPFAEFVPLISEWMGAERAAITYSPGKEPSATIGKAALGFTPALGPDGNPTVVKNAMMAFRTDGYEIGKGSGKVKAFDVSYTSNYGEHAEFEFAG